jgi:hypothetical protein
MATVCAFATPASLLAGALSACLFLSSIEHRFFSSCYRLLLHARWAASASRNRFLLPSLKIGRGNIHRPSHPSLIR